MAPLMQPIDVNFCASRRLVQVYNKDTAIGTPQGTLGGRDGPKFISKELRAMPRLDHLNRICLTELRLYSTLVRSIWAQY